jgi:hypothetical protein
MANKAQDFQGSVVSISESYYIKTFLYHLLHEFAAPKGTFPIAETSAEIVNIPPVACPRLLLQYYGLTLTRKLFQANMCIRFLGFCLLLPNRIIKAR